MFTELRKEIRSRAYEETLDECVINLVETEDIKNSIIRDIEEPDGVDDVELSPEEESKLEKTLDTIPEDDTDIPLTQQDVDDADDFSEEDDDEELTEDELVSRTDTTDVEVDELNKLVEHLYDSEI